MHVDKDQKRPYVIQPYDPAWVLRFESIRERLSQVFGAKALRIEHVGSTSVPGMKAKPVIDVLIEVGQMEDFAEQKRAMQELGYKWAADYVALGTLLFFKEDVDGGKTENIHVMRQDSPEARSCLAVRDYLRSHPEEVRAYIELKEQLNSLHPDDYPAYRGGKDAFLKSLEQRANEWSHETAH